MPPLGFDDACEWPYLTKLANYKTIRCAGLVFIVDRFYKNTSEYFCHSHSDIAFIIHTMPMPIIKYTNQTIPTDNTFARRHNQPHYRND